METLSPCPRDQQRASILWYFTHHLGRLRTLDRAEVIRIANQADVVAERNPMHMVLSKFTLENYCEGLSGFSVTGLLIACVWVLGGEDADDLEPLIHQYPELPAHVAYANSLAIRQVKGEVDRLRHAVRVCWQEEEGNRA